MYVHHEKTNNMKFIFAEIEKQKFPVFEDVEINQFFVDKEGYLCQKEDARLFSVIAFPGGSPCCLACQNGVDDMPITRILPKVKQIEF
jgi:hypothetical protein